MFWTTTFERTRITQGLAGIQSPWVVGSNPLWIPKSGLAGWADWAAGTVSFLRAHTHTRAHARTSIGSVRKRCSVCTGRCLAVLAEGLARRKLTRSRLTRRPMNSRKSHLPRLRCSRQQLLLSKVPLLPSPPQHRFCVFAPRRTLKVGSHCRCAITASLHRSPVPPSAGYGARCWVSFRSRGQTSSVTRPKPPPTGSAKYGTSKAAGSRD